MTRTSLPTVLTAILAGFFSLTALAADPAPAEKAASPAAVTAQSDEGYTPPPGFKSKVRKGETVYCRSRAPIGTRIKSEECFTAAEIREVERAMAISSEDTQQRGRMCNKGFMCTGGG
jgi:hypothetical protein